MRLLHAYSGNLYGGVETLLVTLARQAGVSPEIQSHYAVCFEGRLSDELTAAGAPVYLLGSARISRPWTVWRARRRLARLLTSASFDAVICHSCWPHALFGSVVRASGLPLIFWSHDTPAGRHWLERWARRTRPDLALANSRMTLAALPNLFPGVRSQVLYCPVAAPPKVDRDGVRRSIRQSLDTPADAVVILQASRLEPWKGHALLLDALGRLSEVPGWVCWIAGGAQRPHEQQYRESLRHKADDLGVGRRVQFLGQRADVARLLTASDIHCQPNTGPEPFGIAFVEALYAGLPVVTTALGGALEIVDEASGILVTPGNAAELAQRLRELILDPAARARLGAAGPARATSLCDPGKQLRQLAAAIHALRCSEPLAGTRSAASNGHACGRPVPSVSDFSRLEKRRAPSPRDREVVRE